MTITIILGTPACLGPTLDPLAQGFQPLCDCLEMEEAASFTSPLLAVIVLLASFMSKEREIICVYLHNIILTFFLRSEILWYYQISHILKLISTRPNQTQQLLFLEISLDSPPCMEQLHHF